MSPDSFDLKGMQKGTPETGKTSEMSYKASKAANNQGKVGRSSSFSLPSISLPKGGGAIRGIGEKFSANPVTGTGSLNVPISTSRGRSGFGPQLSLSYDSGSGNGPFGFGWSLSLPSITRKTDKGLPKYKDNVDELEEEDVFILSGAEDLVPVFRKDQNGKWIHDEEGDYILEEEERDGYDVRQYRPRIEGLFARIERWTHKATGDVHWRSISKDNILTVYGKDEQSRIADAAADDGESQYRRRIFSWLISQSYDDKGNAILYEYSAENNEGLDLSQANERNRVRTANRYIKRILYGNRQPLLLDITRPSFRKSHTEQPDFSSADWMFEVVFDYGEDHYKMLPFESDTPEDEQHQLVEASSVSSQGSAWSSRPDPFSVYRAGFEVRTYRRCLRVLMFHRFPELGSEPYLVRSTEFDYSDFDYSQQQYSGILVKNELEHEGSTRFASFIQAVVQSGYLHDKARPVNVVNGVKYLTYLKKSLPPLEFEYSKATVYEEIRELDDASLENLPYGLDNTNYQFVDLDGESISGILLSEQAGAWFYKPNKGRGKFGPVQEVAAKPSFADLNSGRQQLLDLAGDGQLDIVELDGPVPGFYERSKDDKNWETFTPFASLPNIPWKDPSLRFIDLTGDGHADILITEDNAFSWYQSMAEEGFRSAQKVHQALEEEKGPRLVFDDGTQSIYLADMSGDGLTDLVRIRNGEVCYWPNLGYARFGAKVTMDNPPWFDAYDLFDQKHIRLADVDASGVTDILYVGRRNGVQIYFNQSGNRWSDAYTISNFPHIDNLSSSIQAIDLLGSGTACLVWSSTLPGNFRRQMRYIDLMGVQQEVEKEGGVMKGRQKPHLLVGSKNNLGAETRVYYAPSTKFYLDDKQEGKPWISRLPFPVHVVERVETYDKISRNRFVTSYDYHHGYFDGEEREFRGFGLVEQLDTEIFATVGAGDNMEASSHVPPVHTKTWFHTGIYLGREHVSNFFAGQLDAQDRGEYYREPAWQDDDNEAKKHLLDDTVLTAGLTIEEEREACRALKGWMLRQEVYASDGTDKAQDPYTVIEQNFAVRMLQPRGNNKKNRHAVFLTHTKEAITYHYERNPTDPRISHALTLEADDFGNVLKSAAIGYGRRIDAPDPALLPEDREKQSIIHITCTENIFTNPIIDEADAYRIPLPAETRTCELRKPQQEKSEDESTKLYQFNALLSYVNQAGDGSHDIDYEDIDFIKAKEAATNDVEEGNKYFRRLIEQVRTVYRKNDLTDLLALGALESLALPGEMYELAFTSGLITKVYQREDPPQSLIPNPPSSVFGSKDPDGGAYVDLDGDGNWWIPSGQVFYWQETLEDPQTELEFAAKHFFLPHRFRDPFGKNSVIAYDGSEADSQRNHNLLLTKTRDALDNTFLAQNNYRVLQPKHVTDPNGGVNEMLFDSLGLVVATAVHKEALGDSLSQDAQADLTQKQLEGFFANPRGQATTLLSTASTCIVYDTGRYYLTGGDPDKPAYAASIARETHVSDPSPEGGLKTQISISYSDGFGREIQKKIQAEPGLVNDVPTDPRWVGSGWTILNNKGKTVRKYEPFFDDTHQFRFGKKEGVSPIIFYDPLDRVVATLHPNNTYEKVVFNPWKQKTYDVNDTVKLDPRIDEDINSYLSEYFDTTQPDSWQTWYAQRIDGTFGNTPEARDAEKYSAMKAAVHNDTPTIVYFDTLGRPFLAAANNGKDANGNDIVFRTRIILDIEGNQREVRDAKVQNGDAQGRIVMRYEYDMLGNRIKQASMDAGMRWVLNNVNGKPIRAWDSRGFERRMSYDALQRPTELFVSAEGANTGTGLLLAEKTTYGESKQDPEITNHRLKVWEVRDGAGILVNEAYDFKGNLVQSTRQLLSDYKTHFIHWKNNPDLEDETFSSITLYNALDRPVQTIAPHSSRAGTKLNVIQPVYNESNLIERIDVWLEQQTEPDGLLDPETATQHFIKDIDYNAKGQREYIEYGMKDGNSVWSSFKYDEETFRLVHLQTTRIRTGHSGEEELLQDLYYTYDPIGNIMHIHDNAEKEFFVKGRWVEASTDYTYDPIYRLIEAIGREHLGVGSANTPEPTSATDDPRVGLNLNDPNFMGTYQEKFVYDSVGNIEQVKHEGTDPSNPGWTRLYYYNEDSLLEPGKKSNQTTYTTVRGNTYVYKYDLHGNTVRMPNLQNHTDADESNMHWDFKDQLNQVDLRGGGTANYAYDTGGQRVRKVHEHAGALIEERIYLGEYEIYRKRNGSGVFLERECLHIAHGDRRMALVETRTIDVQDVDLSPRQLIRYQYGNHLGSASLELDEYAKIISYEEYYPYGCTSYQAARSQTETSKRYRYGGEERDDGTGLYYHSERYYIPWLGRWTTTDPAGLTDGSNLYRFVHDNPVILTDPSGTSSKSEEEHNRMLAALKRRGATVRTYNLGRDNEGREQKKGSALARLGPKKPPTDNSNAGASPKMMESPAESESSARPSKSPSGSSSSEEGEQKGDMPTTQEGQKGDMPTTMDMIAKLAGILNFQKTEGEGVSGGIPGGMGSEENASQVGQALFAGLSFAGAINFVRSIGKLAAWTLRGAINFVRSIGKLAGSSVEKIGAWLLTRRVATQAMAQMAGREAPEVIKQYVIFGNKALIGKTFYRNIWYIKTQLKSLKDFKALVAQMEKEAVEAGAEKIVIRGHAVVNEGFLSPRVAKALGYEIKKTGNDSVELVKILSRELTTK